MKDIKGYEGLYSVTDDGYVFSHKRGKYLRPTLNADKRNIVSLYKDGKYKQMFVAVLVAEAFLPNKDLLPYVSHKGETFDDRAEMLKWTSGPTKKGWIAGVYDGIKGEGNTKAKLTNEAVDDIRCSDKTVEELADKYGVSYSTVYKVRTYRMWKHRP